MGSRFVLGLAATAALCFLAACDSKPQRAAKPTPLAEEAVTSEAPEVSTSTPTPRPQVRKPTPERRATIAASPTPNRVAVRTEPPPAELWKEVSGDRAWKLTKQLADLGPRPAGSPEVAKARGLLAAELRTHAWEVEEQSFRRTTPQGEVSGTNLIARFSADGSRPVDRTPRPVLLGAHYDSRRFSTIRSVAANEAGSGPALIAELARVLAMDPALAARVAIVLFDACEPLSQYSADDGLAGSRHYAQGGVPKHALILKGVGDADSAIMLSRDTSADLVGELRAAVPAIQSKVSFSFYPTRVWSDHLSLGPGAMVWGNFGALFRNTADDTIERVDPATLGRVGQVAVWIVRHWVR